MAEGNKMITIYHKTADERSIPLRTLDDVTSAMSDATKAKSVDAMARLLMRHGRLTPEAYRYLEGFVAECPKCGLLNGHRFPCAS
jgi:hypothetical protein